MKLATSLNRSLLAGAIALPLAAVPGAAWAHAHLEASVPVAAVAEGAAPSELRLTFSEPVELAFSDIVVRGAGGEEVAAGELALDADGATLVLPLETPLAAGGYIVEWTTVAGDGHKVSGSYGLTIAP